MGERKDTVPDLKEITIYPYFYIPFHSVFGEEHNVK